MLQNSIIEYNLYYSKNYITLQLNTIYDNIIQNNIM